MNEQQIIDAVTAKLIGLTGMQFITPHGDVRTVIGVTVSVDSDGRRWWETASPAIMFDPERYWKESYILDHLTT